MPLNIAIGTQWGDEGKGRIVDLLSSEAALVCRFNGGDNAGHTVTVGSQTFKLHLIPSGIVHPHTIGLLGNGMVINPLSLLAEIDSLKQANVDVSPKRILISPLAHLITPAHRLLDQAQDEARGKDAIGTTGRGIGPAYVDKTARRGLRTGDILDESAFFRKTLAHFQQVDNQLQTLFHKPPINVDTLTKEWVSSVKNLAPYIQDFSHLLRDSLKTGKQVLAEGAQGALLDLDFGTYPFVTSSCTTATGVFGGLGLGIMPVNRIIGITKAFQTRVGAGPFPTELFDETTEKLRGTGANPWDEFGTTTGRPRRVGWLDGILLRYTVDINGVNELCVTKLDILSGFHEIKICTAYEYQGNKYDSLPCGLDSEKMTEYKPIFEVLPGWQEDITSIRSWDALPHQARAYILKVEEFTGVPVSLISVGPERDQIVRRG